jgi:hypothetical protein
VPRFNLKFREKSSKDSFLSQTAIRSYAVLYLILGLLANFFFFVFFVHFQPLSFILTNRPVFEGTLDWAPVLFFLSRCCCCRSIM